MLFYIIILVKVSLNKTFPWTLEALHCFAFLKPSHSLCPLHSSLSHSSSCVALLPSYSPVKTKIEISCCANSNLNAPKWPASLKTRCTHDIERPPTTSPPVSLPREASATCGRNLNLSFSASIRCSELSGITRPKAECIFVYVKDKQMNKVDFPTRTQMPPFRQASGRRGVADGWSKWGAVPAGHYLHNNYAAQCSWGIFNFKVTQSLRVPKCICHLPHPRIESYSKSCLA